MKRGDIFLSVAESAKFNVISRVVDGVMTIKEAANMLGLSERQIKRLKKGAQTEGAAALVHKNRGRSPKHALSGGEHCQILELAVSLYKDTSCQHMSELLAEHQSITASAKTIARVLHKANVKLRFGKKQARRRRSRDRMPQEGMLVQLDASLHSWLDNHRKLALHGAIDDATGKILALSFRPTEDQEGYFSVLEQMLNQYGTPMSFYSDRHTIFFSPKRNKLSIDEELAGAMAPQSQFGRALRELGILHIPASSAQAKGRIERLWGTLQSRLVVEMRSCPRNGYRRRERLPQKLHKAFYDRFAVTPRDLALAYGNKLSPLAVAQVCCVKVERTISNGSHFSYSGQSFQLVDAKGEVIPLRPKSKITLMVRRETVRGLYDGLTCDLKRIEKPPRETSPKPPKDASPKQPTQTPWRNWSVTKPRPPKDPVEKYFDQESSFQHYANSTEVRNTLGET